MWVLCGNEKSPDVTHYLWCNRDILVGRRTDIKLEDDKSISREHACIHIVYGPDDVTSPSSRGRVTLADRSKYGTSVNGQRLEGDCTLSDGDAVTFGLQWNTWTLSWRPLAVATSLLSPAERTSVTEALAELGGSLLTDWSPAVSYLVMSSFKMSVKAVLALASGTAVVTPQYLREMAVCVQNRVAPDVRPADFEPMLDEPTLDGSGCTIGVARERSTLFFGKRFVFATEAQLQRMKQAIELAGGTALLLSSCGLSPAELAERDVIVMHTELKSPDINKLRAVLKRARRRLVKDQEIGLAILRTSMERDCNPAFDYTTSFLPPPASTQSQSMIGTVLAKETQATDELPSDSQPPPAATREQQRRVVPPTPPTPAGEGSTVTQSTRRSTRHSDTDIPPTPAGSVTPTQFTRRSTRQSDTEFVPPTPTPASASAVPPSPVTPRPPEPDWGDGGGGKRPRREPAGPSTMEAAVGPAPPSLEMLAATTPGRRSRDPVDEEPESVFKRPRLSGSTRARPAAAAAAAPAREDEFDFDLELSSRPPPRAPAPAAPAPLPKVKRECPSPIPETPPSREPSRPLPDRRVPKTEPSTSAGDDGWISSCRRTEPPPPAPAKEETSALPKREKVSVAEDGDTSALINSCIRLQISELICPRRPQQRDATTADDSSAGGPNFKRFRRVRQPPILPRIIGGSDLYAVNRPRHGQSMTNGSGQSMTNGAGQNMTNGNGRRSDDAGRRPPSDDEDDDLGDAQGRQEAHDDEMFRLLDSVGRNRNSRRR